MNAGVCNSTCNEFIARVSRNIPGANTTETLKMFDYQELIEIREQKV